MAKSDLEMKIVSIAMSKKKGTPKVQVEKASLLEDHGLKGDAHAGPWHRQVSFLAAESIEKARKKGLDVGFGDFAENIATLGIDWQDIPVGTRVNLGDFLQDHQSLFNRQSTIINQQSFKIRTGAPQRTSPPLSTLPKIPSRGMIQSPAR